MITNFIPTILNNGSILFEWSSTIESPTFYLYRNGIFLGTQIQNNYTITGLKQNELIRFEVFDNSTDRPEEFFDNFFYTQFYVTDVNNINAFKIEEKINDSSSFTLINQIIAKTGLYHYSFFSNYYEDDDEVTLRITPILNNKTEGEYFELTKKIITYPESINSEIYVDSGSLYIDIKPSLEDSLIITGDTSSWFPET